MGSIPPTKLLLTCDKVVVGEFINYTAIALHLDAGVSATGECSVLGLADTVRYIMDEWTVEEALKDFARYRMGNLIARKGYRIYRYLT